MNGTDYTEEKDFEITTLDDAIYIKMKNDVSLLVDSYLSLWEQQSSYNPNMPLRGLMYFGNLYDAYIDGHELNIYGGSLVKIPTPQYIVFYNGNRDMEAVRKLKLSDAFAQQDTSHEFEWTATMYNLNKGKNEELLSRCKPLQDYMSLINYIRENQEKGMPVKDAVDQAVVKCINSGILADFLKSHRAEVMDVCITEYNEKTFIDGIRAEGRDEGIKEGRLSAIQNMIELGLTKEQILKKYTEEEYEQVEQRLLKNV